MPPDTDAVVNALDVGAMTRLRPCSVYLETNSGFNCLHVLVDLGLHSRLSTPSLR